jgi:hypothetical protein
MALKYFHYLSKAKLEMLTAQMRRPLLSTFSVAPKIQFAGLSVGAEVKGEAGKAPVADALKVIDYLKKHDAINEFESFMAIDTSRFYHSETEWRHGVFYFATMVSVTGTYLLWTTRGDSLTLLAGSPANIIGQTTPVQGVTLSSTGDALNTLGSSSFLEEIREEEENHFSSALHVQATLPLGRPPFSHIDWIYTIHTGSRAAPLAMFCFRYLSQLPSARIDTVFKLFSTFRSAKADCQGDLYAEHQAAMEELNRDETTKPEWERGPAHRQYVEERWARDLSDGRRFNLQLYKNVYLGSPVYTALV